MNNSITKLFNIKYPIIQGGMVWCSGWELAAAVSQAGGLGLLGAGSMHPDTFRQHIQKTKQATSKPFGVNIPLFYPEIEEIMNIIVEEKVKIVFTSAGNPKLWTSFLKEQDITVVHVVSNSKFAQKAEQAGVDALVIEGFEAGGHNGREETSSLVAIPKVKQCTSLPLIAAGGFSCGKSLLSALVLGADGVQMGTRFIATEECSAHQDFKQMVCNAQEGSTELVLKKLMPVRLLKNPFYDTIKKMESEGQTAEQLNAVLGKGRAKKGMFEGDMTEGELEAGQVSCLIDEILPTQTVIDKIIEEYHTALKSLEKSSRFSF